MRYLITGLVAFTIGFATGDYRPEADASLEFRQDDIVLHVGADSIVLDNEISAAIALDINNHLKGRR